MAAAARTVLGPAGITAEICELGDSTAAQSGAAFALFADFIGGTSSCQVPFIAEHTETAGWLAWLFLRAEVRAAGSMLIVHGRDARMLRMDWSGEDDPSARALSRLR